MDGGVASTELGFERPVPRVLAKLPVPSTISKVPSEVPLGALVFSSMVNDALQTEVLVTVPSALREPAHAIKPGGAYRR